MKKFSSMNEDDEQANMEDGLSQHMGLHEFDESSGSEFLDESLRMTEQPLKKVNKIIMRKNDLLQDRPGGGKL